MDSESATYRLSELCDRKPKIDDVRCRLNRSQFSFIELSDAEIMHVVQCDEGWVIVVGNPACASYEWVYVQCARKSRIDEIWEHSNDGFGSQATALFYALSRIVVPGDE